VKRGTSSAAPFFISGDCFIKFIFDDTIGGVDFVTVKILPKA